MMSLMMYVREYARERKVAMMVESVTIISFVLIVVAMIRRTEMVPPAVVLTLLCIVLGLRKSIAAEKTHNIKRKSDFWKKSGLDDDATRKKVKAECKRRVKATNVNICTTVLENAASDKLAKLMLKIIAKGTDTCLSQIWRMTYCYYNGLLLEQIRRYEKKLNKK